jgi:hypothetical protein
VAEELLGYVSNPRPSPTPSQELLDFIGEAYDGPAAPRLSVLTWHLRAA